MIFNMYMFLVHPYLVWFEIYIAGFILNVLRSSSYSLFFWVLIHFDKTFFSFNFFKLDFNLDFGLGFGLCFRSNQWTFIRFLVELKVLSQLSKLGWRLRLCLTDNVFAKGFLWLKVVLGKHLISLVK